MAKTKTITGYEILIANDPGFCGIGAGGVQFAYGKALIADGRMVEWFREHEGYEVKEIEKTEAEKAAE